MLHMSKKQENHTKLRLKRHFFSGVFVLGVLTVLVLMQNCGETPQQANTQSKVDEPALPAESTEIDLASVPATRPRGRPVFRKGTLYTDTGTMLRGSYVSLDIEGRVAPTRAQLRAMKAMGLNAVHLYAESPGNGSNPPDPSKPISGCGYSSGTKLNQAMRFNELLKQEGLYLIITIGHGCTTFPWPPATPQQGDRSNLQFALNFWVKYATEFASDTNVVFELYNEPYFYWDANNLFIAQPSSNKTRELMALTYALVRERAPHTPILLFSYGALGNATGVRADIQAVKQKLQSSGGRPLENWGIAFHAYELPLETQASVARALLDDGLSLVMTELQSVVEEKRPGYCTIPGGPINEYCVNREMVQLFEKLEISWLNFIMVEYLNFEKFKAQINYGIDWGSIIWAPDFGRWPASSSPPAAGTVVALRAKSNNLWVTSPHTAIPQTPTVLVAKPQNVSTSEEFIIVRSGNGVCLKSRASGKIVDPQWTSSNPSLLASKATCLPEYSFQWLVLPDNSIVLRAPHRVTSAANRPSWRIVSADANIGNELIANRLLMGEWEKFQVQVVSAQSY